jgi:NADPH-dependent 2,4-dienoyl-CoA reductase/sulfur reductase-like enzyme
MRADRTGKSAGDTFPSFPSLHDEKVQQHPSIQNNEAGDRMNRDYIIVGSGFGGSVTACRLAQRNKKVLAFERGRRREDRNFPVGRAFA